MNRTSHFSAEDAWRVGEQIGIDWEAAPFDVEQFRAGMDVELEHGTRLQKMEAEAESAG